MRISIACAALLVVLILATTGCVRETQDRVAEDADRTALPVRQIGDQSNAVSVYSGVDTLSREALEEGRYDESWRTFAEVDSLYSRSGLTDNESRPDTARADTSRTTSPRPDTARTDRSGTRTRTASRFAMPVDTTENEETWDDITAEAVNRDTMHVPLEGKIAGPSVLRVQILLDRIRFSPGIIDGRWGKNTEKAVYWLQKREGLEATGTVDQATLNRLMELAGTSEPWIAAHALTADEVAGPFVDIPSDIYEKAELDGLGYESLLEKLSELFHATPELLQKLNPDVTFDGLAAGTAIQVPNLNQTALAPEAQVAELVISDKGFYVHALDSTGYLLYHFPSTLGSSYDPSPRGDYEVTSITEDPWWHYQPDILAHVDDSEPDAHIPPGPNSAVGVVWMALSEPHYGIHGTSAPETIGYVTSAGCVRLTNWDARFLARQIEAGTPVSFHDTEGTPS